MAYKALDIANKIIKSVSDNGLGDLISNMKLQKLLYYQQGFHLAYFETPLFDEELEAWMYGPVVPSVYNQFKIEKNNALYYNGDVISLTRKEESLFDEVMNVYGEFSAVGLMNMTHQEAPWKETQIGVGNIIERSKLQSFFKTKLK
ncbi:MAG: DUF4065 domain-containing protein [Tannerella sp.]|jgi:uncharacterized phage-associated protein|nr:DUF4065 domain-containing protein [Tannerella sp.]